MIDGQKKTRGKNWKSYCNSICTKCNTIFFVKTANRYCYEDKYNLPQVPKKIIYKKNGVSNIVATGVIDHETYGDINDSGGGATWEEGFQEVIHDKNDDYMYIMKRTCKDLGIDSVSFIKVLKRNLREFRNESKANWY